MEPNCEHPERALSVNQNCPAMECLALLFANLGPGLLSVRAHCLGVYGIHPVNSKHACLVCSTAILDFG